jgi:hypothetical protein
MGVGSEVFGAVANGRRGIGFELKTAYFAQAVKNLENVDVPVVIDQATLFDKAIEAEEVF